MGYRLVVLLHFRCLISKDCLTKLFSNNGENLCQRKLKRRWGGAYRNSNQSYRNFEPGTIWTADNLKIMRGMNSNTVDLIYLDPPFNSNKKWQRPLDGKLQAAIETVIENDDDLFQKWLEYVDKNKDASNRVIIKFNDAWEYNAEKEEQHQTIIRERFPALHQIIEGVGESYSLKMKAYMIFMAVRLIEMKRILSKSGSIYLHCDDSAGHYLKILMDAVFGNEMFRAHISWKRQPAKSMVSKNYGRVSDHILYYATSTCFFDPQYLPLDEEYVEKKYTRKDEKGRYMLINVVGYGGHHYDWKGWQPPEKGWGITKDKCGSWTNKV